jgi:hypothetical protein
MKKENHNTGYVMLKAFTNSEWDACDFVIVKVTDEWRQVMQKRLELVIPFKEDNSFYHHSYWESPEGFFKNPDDESQSADEIIGENEDWCFVSLEEKELENLPVPENSLECHQLIIDRYGNASFKAYGKHSGEDFYTADFHINKLFAQTKSENERF